MKLPFGENFKWFKLTIFDCINKVNAYSYFLLPIILLNNSFELMLLPVNVLAILLGQKPN